MSKILEVLNRKSVELKSEVVELGVLQDLDKINKSAMKDIVNHKGDVLEALSSLEKAADKSRNLEKSFNSLSNGIKEIETKMKSLGMDTTGIQELSIARTVKKEIEDFIGGVQKISSTASGLKNRI